MQPSRTTTSDDDQFLLVVVGSVAAMAALGSAGQLWSRCLTWLVHQRVLTAASTHPILTLPLGRGAGLDGPRLAIAAGVVTALLACTGSALRRSWRARQAIQ